MAMMISALGKHIHKHTRAANIHAHILAQDTHTEHTRKHTHLDTHTYTHASVGAQTHTRRHSYTLIFIYSMKCLMFYFLKFENVY